MSYEDTTDDKPMEGRVGFRDIYRAVGESEARIKEHITLVVSPITASLADHEARLRIIESQGTPEAQQALTEVAAVEGRVGTLERMASDYVARESQRKRIADLSTRSIVFIIIVSNFVVATSVALSHILQGAT